MYSESIRDMNERERLRLLESLQFSSPISSWHTLKWAVVWASVLVVLSLLGGLLLGVPESYAILAVPTAVALIVTWIICLFALTTIVSGYFRWRRYARDFHRNTVPRIRAALERGRVSSKHVAADSVIVIEELEDEGAGYIFDVGEGKSLILKGQQYCAIGDDMPWPASEFEIVRSADSGVWIGIFSSGSPLEPSRTVKMEDCSEGFVWADMEELVQGTSEEVLETIRRHTRK